MKHKARAIAFYLPQFYPTIENDEWWEPGFTEWTNVVKSKPLFEGHYQPRLPRDLGFYDLRVKETREKQAELAKECGIEGFCYWHYWFAGRRLLNDVFEKVIEEGPNFPFCLCWANHSWYAKTWTPDAPDKLLIEQTYPGEEDYISHFKALLPAFKDKRYIKVNGKLLFGIFESHKIPDYDTFTTTWNKLAEQNGLPGFYFFAFAQGDSRVQAIETVGAYDAIVYDKLLDVFTEKWEKENKQWYQSHTEDFPLPLHIEYEEYASKAITSFMDHPNYIPCIDPDFDHSPRSGKNGIILHESTPEKWESFCSSVTDLLKDKDEEERIFFIKAWNEWGEGNYLEPDRKWGKKYLEALERVLRCDTVVPKKDTLVSIVVPIYNVEKYLPCALDSLVNQTLKEIEIICVIDGATDRSHEIALEYACRDSRVKVIYQENKGTFIARKNGCQIASGDYIAFLDPDDWFEQHTCSLLVETIKKTDADILQFGFAIEKTDKTTDQEVTTIDRYINKESENIVDAEKMLRQCFIYDKIGYNQCGKVFKSQIIKSAMQDLPDIRCNFAEDLCTGFMLFSKATKFVQISDKLYHYRIGIGISTKRKIDIEDFKSILKSMDFVEYIKDYARNKFHNNTTIKEVLDIIEKKVKETILDVALERLSTDVNTDIWVNLLQQRDLSKDLAIAASRKAKYRKLEIESLKSETETLRNMLQKNKNLSHEFESTKENIKRLQRKNLKRLKVIRGLLIILGILSISIVSYIIHNNI